MSGAETENNLHVGIIMDGNGRWAAQRGLPRAFGHDEGLKAIKRLCPVAGRLGIKYLSIYAFSTENWKRTQEEVTYLVRLIHNNIRKELDYYTQNKIRLLYSGDKANLPEYVRDDITDVERQTEAFTGLCVNLAFNYGGRDEIIRAIKKIPAQKLETLDEAAFRSYLDLDIKDPDLIIRTAGEQRMSNFLLWQSAYSELYFSPKLWPDFTEDDLKSALEEFKARNRKFGGQR
jgi:undecaprenyl diphosphate synthase